MNVLFLFSSPTGDIPLSPEDFSKPLRLSPSSQHPFLKLEDFFQAACTFLLEDHRDSFFHALLDGNEISRQENSIRTVAIRSEKQGLLYHVASVEIEGKDLYRKFSLISAVTRTGRKVLETEFLTLTRLNRKFPLAELPKSYFNGTVKVTRRGEEENISFFLGEWFEGYHEYHLSRDGNGNPYLCIWDLEGGLRAATEEEFREIFRQASRMLTRLYDPDTANQVLLWHHAAGDFVVGKKDGATHIRLTTVRRYGPLLDLPEIALKDSLGHLLFFFLDMTVKMRLDKWDGVGDPVWLEGEVTETVLQGFLEALGMMVEKDQIGSGFFGEFVKLLRSFSREEFFTAFGPLRELYSQSGKEEFSLIERWLENHVAQLAAAINRLPLSGP